MQNPKQLSRTICRLLAGLVLTTGTLLAVGGEAQAQQDDLPETPVEYERFALKQNPQLQTLYQRWQAARSEAKAEASSWPQPRIGYRTFIDGWWHDDPRLRHRGTISQTFPWPGALDDAADPALKRAEAITHRFQARVLAVVFEVRRLLVDIARIEALIEILEEQRTVYADVVAIVEQTMETGEAEYADLLRVNTAREKIADRIDTLRSDRQQRIAELRELLELGPDVELTFDFGDDGLLDVVEETPPRAKLVEAARQEHPALAAERTRAASLRQRAEYARVQRLPWPTLSLGVDSVPDRMGTSGYDRRTALMVHVSVPLPIFLAQYQHEQQNFEHQRRAVLAEREQTVLELTAGVDKAITRISEKLRRLERYRQDLVPLASDATEQLLNKIETGERDVTDYLLSFEQELDLETNLVEFRATIATERARLERLTGGEFDAFPNRPSPSIDIQDTNETRETNE